MSERGRKPGLRGVVTAAVFAGSLVACSGPDNASDGTVGTGTFITGSPSSLVELPAPRTAGAISLEEALGERRSARSFTPETLTIEEVSQLLWAAQGITASWGGRTAPSAGALYPLEIYVADGAGLSRYLPDGHGLAIVADGDIRADLAHAAHDQAPVAEAPAVFAITAIPARTESKYGDRALRYVYLEAGHAAQNLLLQATALGLGGVPIGAFDDAEVAQILHLPEGEVPIYLIPVGHPSD